MLIPHLYPFQRSMSFILIILIHVCTATFTLNPHNTIFIFSPIDTGYNARKPLSLTWRDLQQDWYKVLGIRPSTYIGTERPSNFTGTAIYIGAAASNKMKPKDPHPEAHSIFAINHGNNKVDIILTGNSPRAEIYAAYAFSECVLGVAPLYWWTDTEPTYQGTITFNSTADLAIDFNAPTFKWRGFFPNDEDLLGNFSPDPLGQSMFSSETWNRICEALLRLKGNLIIAGTVSFPDESHYDVIRRRGVFVSMQHFTLLGVNTWRWPEGIPYSFDQNPEIQEHVWKACLDAYQGREAVWTIGYRGLNDYAFWRDEPKFNTTKSRCKLISDAMAKQAELARAVPGRENDEFVTYLWSEMLDLYLSGELVIPPSTNLVFADQGGSGKFDPRIYDRLKQGDGVYYHVQMESPGKMSQLTEMVPPKSFYDQLKFFVKANATSYFMLNLSDLKPAAFMVDTIMRYLWNPFPVINMDNNAAAETLAIRQWCKSMFGLQFQDVTATIVSDYFNIEYIRANSTNTTQRFGDEHLSGTLRNLLTGQEEKEDALAFVKIPLVELETLYANAVKVHTEMALIRSPGASFFQSSFLLFIATHWFGCTAIEALAKEDTTGALDALDALRAIQRQAEGTKWKGLYSADRLVDFANVDCLIRSAQNGSTNPNPIVCNLPNGNPYRRGTGEWSDWFTYADTTTNYPYLNAPSVEWSMELIVRILCNNDGCVNTPVGGTFTGDVAVITMTVPWTFDIGDKHEIRYTLDGSEPTVENVHSMIYDKEFNVSKTTKINARVFVTSSNYAGQDNLPSMLVTRPTFTKKMKEYVEGVSVE